jgi:dihydrodipicolinate synthase/N-acetylneuraminate lyase
MAKKFSQMLDALKAGDRNEAVRILEQLFPDIQKYSDRELPTANIATGIRR